MGTINKLLTGSTSPRIVYIQDALTETLRIWIQMHTTHYQTSLNLWPCAEAQNASKLWQLRGAFYPTDLLGRCNLPCASMRQPGTRGKISPKCPYT